MVRESPGITRAMRRALFDECLKNLTENGVLVRSRLDTDAGKRFSFKRTELDYESAQTTSTAGFK